MSRRNRQQPIDEELNFLKLTIQHFNNENIEMKNQIEDLKITLNSDKKLMQEYLLQISDKDSTVVKLNNTIEQLKKRLHTLEFQQLISSKKNNNFRIGTHGSRESENVSESKYKQSNNLSMRTNNISTQPRSLSVIKTRKTNYSKYDIEKKEKLKPNKASKIKQTQDKIKLGLTQMRHKLDLIQHMYLRTVEKIKEGKKLSNVVLFDENEDKNKNVITYPKKNIFVDNFSDDEKKVILFMDDQSQIWEIEPLSYISEDILKQGNFDYLKNIQKINFYNENIKENEKNEEEEVEDDDEDFDISLNNSFYNEIQNEEDNEDLFYDENKVEKSIYKDTQGSNIANCDDFLTEYK